MLYRQEELRNELTMIQAKQAAMMTTAGRIKPPHKDEYVELAARGNEIWLELQTLDALMR